MPLTDLTPGPRIEVGRGALRGMVKHLYEAFASNPYAEVFNIDEGLHRMALRVCEAAGHTPEMRTRLSEPVKVPAKVAGDRRVLVAYSGGKDSLAAALQVRKEGMRPYLYHVTGLNRSYPREAEVTQRVSDRLNVPLIVEAVKLTGTHAWPDNPVKDQLILAMMVDVGCDQGIRMFTSGLERENSQQESSLLYNFSDSAEMIQEFNNWIRHLLPDYAWRYMLENDSQSYRIIWDNEPDAIELVASCVTPHRFQDMRKKQNEEKYGIRLLPYRCGSCWKCCVDYLCLAAYGWCPLSVEYGRKCLDVFDAAWATAYGPTHKTQRTRADVLAAAVDARWVDVAPLEVLL